MKSKDVAILTREELAQKFNEALTANDADAVAQALADMAEAIQSEVMERAKETANIDQLDAQALAARGLRQLTSSEKKYYEALAKAMRSEDPKQALAHLDVTMPETIIEDVFESLRMEHALLAAVNFVNTTYMTEFIISKNGKQKAIWGELTAEITKELSSDFEKMTMTLYSLTAFLPVAKSMLDLGAQWLDSYVREVLKDAIYVGLEEAIISGNGVTQPIGMMKNLNASKEPSATYPDKEAIAITRIDAASYGSVIAKLAVDRNGRARKVGSLIFVCNPVDYFNKVLAATTVMRPDGTYANDVFPYPTKVIQSEEVPAGKAVVGIGEKYFMGVGTSKDGVIEYDDSVRFLNRERVYAAFLYGNGKPVDNNAFEVLDISGLQPASYVVRNESGVAAANYAGGMAVAPLTTTYTEEDLNNMTVQQIEELAAENGYAISGSNKAEKIASFIAAQSAAV